MVIIKSDNEISLMRKVCKIGAKIHREISNMIKPGINTEQIDILASKIIKMHGAVPSFLGYNGFPKSVCTSINQELIHGIPSKNRILEEGDIVSVDVGVFLNGFHADCADTYAVVDISTEAQKLIDTAKNAFYNCLKYAHEGYRVSDLSHSIQKTIESSGFAVVKEYVGHGVGRDLHEDPAIPNYGSPGRGIRLKRGMTLAIEPMLAIGDAKVKIQPDGWTVTTVNNKLSSHFEHTILITNSEPEILTI